MTLPYSLSYSFAQAGSDLWQVAPITAVTVALLVAMIADLVLPARREGHACARGGRHAGGGGRHRQLGSPQPARQGTAGSEAT